MLKGFMLPTLTMNASVISRVKALGANAVRWQLVDLGPRKTGTAYLDWLNDSISILEGWMPMLSPLRVVVDLHTPPKDATPWAGSAPDTFIEAHKMLAGRLGRKRVIFGFDLMNEPPCRTRDDVKLWNELAAKAAGIHWRKNRLKMILKSLPYGDASRTAAITGLKGERWRLTYHQYYPLRVTHEGISSFPPIGTSLWTGNVEKLLRYVNPVVNLAEKLDTSVVVGEFSCARWSGGSAHDNRCSYLEDCFTVFNKYGWGWIYHAFREADPWDLELGRNPADLSRNENSKWIRLVREEF